MQCNLTKNYCFLLNILQGLIQPSMAILISNWFPRHERGFMYGFMGSATCLGTALGSIFTGYVCASAGGWPYSFYSVGKVFDILWNLMQDFI